MHAGLEAWKLEHLVLEEGFGSTGPTRNSVGRRDSAGMVKQEERIT